MKKKKRKRTSRFDKIKLAKATGKVEVFETEHKMHCCECTKETQCCLVKRPDGRRQWLCKICRREVVHNPTWRYDIWKEKQ